MKISNRDKKLLAVFLIAIFSYVVFVYYIEPINLERAELEDELALLELEVEDIDSLEGSVDRMTADREEADRELNDLLATQNFETMSPPEMLDYVADSYLAYGVESESFERKDIVNKGSYWEVPYVMTVKGEMIDLVRFVNNLYKIDKYFYISDINMEQQDVLPMIMQIQNPGDIDVPFEWSEDFADRIRRDLPLDEILAQEVEHDTEIRDEIHLSLKLHFISLDGEVRE